VQEALLNFIWLVISAAGVWIWLSRWRPRYARNEDRLNQGWMALIVLIFLLFPVISMTDDLHPGPAYAEDSSASKRRMPALQQSAAHRVHSNTHSAAVASLPPQANFTVNLLFSANIVVEKTFAYSSLRSVSTGRSPPALSL